MGLRAPLEAILDVQVLWRKNPAYSEGELQEMETTKLNLLAAKAAMDQTCVQPDSDADVSALACPSCLQREEEERQRQVSAAMFTMWCGCQ